jgi:hypothetical protein
MKKRTIIFIFFLFQFLIYSNCQIKEEPLVPNSLSDEELLDLVQEKTFQYSWEGAEFKSGMARERIHMDGVYPGNDRNVVTIGGSGFGLMALLVGIERGYISRDEGFERVKKITGFLENADRFHGVWPHWLEGESGKVRPFGWDDDGGDLVETALLVQGLLTVRQYFQKGNEEEKQLAQRIDDLWKAVEWSWHLKENEEVLLWHWSPNLGFQKNHAIRGYDETMITYILAVSSPTFPIKESVYHQGWARNGEIIGRVDPFGIPLNLRHNGAEQFGGPLFWAHYSYLGLDPRGLKDQYADYWEHNVNHTLINRAWCIANPNGFKGYGEKSWGLTASYSLDFYAAHKPGNDLGVISPTAAVSSIPYTPEYSIKAMRHWYETFGEKLLGPYGFYDAFSETENWFPQKYLAIDQGPMVVMIENYRTGLLWDLFMSSPEIKEGLQKLGFQSPHF